MDIPVIEIQIVQIDSLIASRLHPSGNQVPTPTI